MDIAFRPPVILLVIFGGVLVAAVLAVLLKKVSAVRRVVGLGIVVVACGALLFFFYRTTHLLVDDAGLHVNAWGRQEIAWSAVTSVRMVPALAGSPYAPTVKTGGVTIGQYHSGWFKLANGATGFVIVEQEGPALVVEGAGKTFVLAPRELQAFTAAVARHVTVTGAAGGAS